MALRLKLLGANQNAKGRGVDKQPGKISYFLDSNPRRWRTGIPTYGKVAYHSVYPGIDLVYYGNQRQLEYDFVLAPGAKPKDILLEFDGAERVEVDAVGDLVIHTAHGEVRQPKPVVYQQIGSERKEVSSNYVVLKGQRVKF